MRSPRRALGSILMLMSPVVGYLPCAVFADAYNAPNPLLTSLVWFAGMAITALFGLYIYATNE